MARWCAWGDGCPGRVAGGRARLAVLRLDDIAELCQGRRYQMNEVARCTQVALGIAAASAGSAGPVALVDLGTGAGLGLQLDRYRYRIGTGTFGPAEASLTAG